MNPSESTKKRLNRQAEIFERLGKLFETKGEEDNALMAHGLGELCKGLAGEIVDYAPLDQKLKKRIQELEKQNRRRLLPP